MTAKEFLVKVRDAMFKTVEALPDYPEFDRPLRQEDVEEIVKAVRACAQE